MAAYSEWVERDDPRFSVARVVLEWIEAAGETPWRWPSVTLDDLSERGMDAGSYDWRQVVVPGTGGVEVYYRHWYQSDRVDVVAVMSPLDERRG